MQVTGAILAVILTTLNLNNPDRHRVAAILNHTSMAFVMGSLVADVIKMSFGLDPAVPLSIFRSLDIKE